MGLEFILDNLPIIFLPDRNLPHKLFKQCHVLIFLLLFFFDLQNARCSLFFHLIHGCTHRGLLLALVSTLRDIRAAALPLPAALGRLPALGEGQLVGVDGDDVLKLLGAGRMLLVPLPGTSSAPASCTEGSST